MKTKEFIKEVEALGFRVEDNRCFLNVLKAHNNETLLSIRKDEALGLNTRQYAFYKLLPLQKESLFNLAVEYASTPVEEREPVKKYYIKLKGSKGDYSHLNFDVNRGEYSMHDSWDDVRGFRTAFTKQDIKDFGLQKFADSELFELVEVDE